MHAVDRQPGQGRDQGLGRAYEEQDVELGRGHPSGLDHGETGAVADQQTGANRPGALGPQLEPSQRRVADDVAGRGGRDVALEHVAVLQDHLARVRERGGARGGENEDGRGRPQGMEHRSSPGGDGGAGLLLSYLRSIDGFQEEGLVNLSVLRRICSLVEDLKVRSEIRLRIVRSMQTEQGVMI